jgi:hypothetical protein
MEQILARPPGFYGILVFMGLNRTSRLAFIVAAALGLGGCFQSTTLLRINADGSGTIEQTTLLTDAALAQLRQLASGGSMGKPLDLFSGKQAQETAANIGPDVTVVSNTRLKTADAEGTKTIFAFPDVNHLRLKQSSGTAALGLTASDAENAQVRLSLTHQSDGHALLRITLPSSKLLQVNPAPTSPAGSGGTPQSRIGPEQLAMIKQLFAGMRISIAVQPDGPVVRTSSPFVDGQKVTLFDFSFDQLLNNDAVFSRLQTARSIDDVKAAMKDIPGLKINLDPEITIEFTDKG